MTRFLDRVFKLRFALAAQFTICVLWSPLVAAQSAPPENACVQNGGRKLCVPGLVKGNWKYLYQYGSCQIGQGLVGAYYNLDQPYGDENTATLEGVAYNAQQNLCNNPSVIDYGAWATPQAPLAACSSPSPSFFALTEDSNVKKTTISCSPNPNVSFQVYRYRPVQCPDGYFLGQSSLCEPIVPPKCDDCKSRTNFGNPVNLSNGNKRQVETDYASPITSLKFVRTYSSLQDNASGRLGRKWTHNYDKRLLLTPGNANVVFAYRGDGSILTHWKESGVWKADGDINDRVTPIVGAGNVITGWLVTVGGGDSVETYDATGTLLSINDRSGASITFSYSTASTPVAIAPVPGLLIGAVDHFGRSLSWKYDTNSYLRRMDLPSGEFIVYDPTFDGTNNLQYATHSSGGARHYLYNETPYVPSNAPKNLLTGIIFEDGSRSIYTYDSAGKPLSTESASPAGAGKYLTTPNAGSNTGAATDPLGTARSYTFTTVQGISLLQQVTQPCPGCQTSTVSSTYGYDANGNTTSIVDFNGNLTCYAFDAGGRNLEIRRTEGLGGSNCASPTYKTESRRIETDWHTSLRIPIAIREYKHNNATSATTLLRTTTYVYDGNNAAANPKGNVTSKSVKDEVNNVTRTWTYSNYDTYGRVGTIDGPRTDVTDTTTYTYYANDVAQGNKRGMLWKVTNAANHVTEITDYDAEGRPLSMTDANGLVTTMAYWPRGWLKQRNVGGELTQYAYDNYGQLLKITMPDSSVINYGYDGAHRLWKISDGVDIN
ncbi:MAG: RHS repeat protein, partial [Betaproteobacteria bacterium]|nr:RHS repeat protein [Betaproteobacteria bacterium]